MRTSPSSLPSLPSLPLLLLVISCGPGLLEPGSSDDGTGPGPMGSGSSGAAGSTAGPGSAGTISGAGTTEGLDSGSSDGTVFIEDPDSCFERPGISAHCVPDCSVVVQDCPAGEKCVPWSNDGGPGWNASRCVPLPDEPVPVGGTCTIEGNPVSGLDDCGLGALCWAVDPSTLQGTCMGLCDPLDPAACEPSSTQCLPLNDGAVPVCLLPCNPLSPSCGEGETCRFVAEQTFACVPVQGGEIDSGTQCSGGQCDPDEICVPSDQVPACELECCTSLCDLGDPDADAQCAAQGPMLACEPFFEAGSAPTGLEQLGACASL